MSKAQEIIELFEPRYDPKPNDLLFEYRDIRVYKTPHYEEQLSRTDKPLGSDGTRYNYYQKCIDYILDNEPKKDKDFLFYGLKSKQGMALNYCVDKLIKNAKKWCFVIITILPAGRLMYLIDELIVYKDRLIPKEGYGNLSDIIIVE